MRRLLSHAKIAACAGTLLILVFALLLVACGSESQPTTTEAPEPDGTTTTETAAAMDGFQLAMSELTRLAPAAPQADVLSVADSMNDFGIDLYDYLATEAGQGNLVFSPSSIAIALAMTYVGAEGITAEEIAATLHLALEGDAVHQAFNSLDTTLESRSWSQEFPDGRKEGVLVKTANSLWGQHDTVFEKLFLDTLAANYGAGMRLVDYRTAAEQARQAINAWVAEETNDKITDLIPQGTLDAMTRLVLVNAVYLDATWLSQFDPQRTTDESFTTLSGEAVTAPMMTQTFSYRVASGTGWQAVELPYVGSELAMLLIVPDEGRFSEVEGRLAGGLVDEVATALTNSGEVNLTMPKFEFRTQAGLNNALGALGMTTSFDRSSADFSGMTKEETLYISDVIHEAYIAVDEEGTEAAAATAIVMRATGMPMEPLVLTIDRPFMFALRDLETGAVLFMGRVTDPTA